MRGDYHHTIGVPDASSLGAPPPMSADGGMNPMGRNGMGGGADYMRGAAPPQAVMQAPPEMPPGAMAATPDMLAYMSQMGMGPPSGAAGFPGGGGFALQPMPQLTQEQVMQLQQMQQMQQMQMEEYLRQMQQQSDFGAYPPMYGGGGHAPANSSIPSLARKKGVPADGRGKRVRRKPGRRGGGATAAGKGAVGKGTVRKGPVRKGAVRARGGGGGRGAAQKDVGDEPAAAPLKSSVKRSSSLRKPGKRRSKSVDVRRKNGKKNRVTFEDVPKSPKSRPKPVPEPESSPEPEPPESPPTKQKPKPTHYKPYTIDDYRIAQAGFRNMKLGGLGANTGGAEWEKKQERRRRMLSAGARATQLNKRRAKNARRSVPPPAKRQLSAREKAKIYSLGVRKGKPKTRRSKSAAHLFAAANSVPEGKRAPRIPQRSQTRKGSTGSRSSGTTTRPSPSASSKEVSPKSSPNPSWGGGAVDTPSDPKSPAAASPTVEGRLQEQHDKNLEQRSAVEEIRKQLAAM